jgi:hypothetical protein
MAPILALVLSACVIVVEDPGGGGGALSVSNITFTSDFQDSAGKSYICDNTFTPTRVTFNYSGDLSTWRVEFRGTNTGKLVSVGEYARGDNKHTESPIGQINMNITFGNGTAPLAVKPQAIVVVPVPQQIGTSNLVITIRNSAGQSAKREFAGLPVISNCP